jgi:uncharacterized protein YegL
MNLIKKITTVIAFTLLLAASVNAQNTAAGNLDVILVLDTSGSMVRNDPQRVAKTAVNLFIEMLGKDSRISVIGFNQRIIFDTELKERNAVQDKRELTARVNALRYAGDTDIGLALKLADSKLKASPSNNVPVVLLLTDGRIDTGNEARDEESMREIEALIQNPAYPIFTVGLAQSGNAKNIDLDTINRIATKTGAGSFVANSAAELPAIFASIFSSVIKSEVVEVGKFNLSGEVSDIPIDVPDAVAEVNVILHTTSTPENVRLIDPLSQEIKFDAAKAHISTYGSYLTLKIILPVRGVWTIRLKGRGEVDVNLTYNYDINLIALTKKTRYKPGDIVTVIGQLSDKNGLWLDDALLSSLTANLHVINEVGVEVESRPMKLRDKVFYSDIKLPEQDSAFEFVVKVDGYKFYREDSIKLRVGSMKPYVKADTPVLEGK